jgi:sugar lactone lactonase YvrE
MCGRIIYAIGLLGLLQTGHVAASPAGIVETIAGGGSVRDGGPAKQARLNLPGGVTEAPNGDWVVVDFGNHRIRRIERSTGIIRTIAGTGEAGFNGDDIAAERAQLSRPEQAVFGPSGDLYIADSYNNRVRRIDVRDGTIHTIAGRGERGASGDDGPAIQAELHFPEGIAVDRSGNVFIADTVNRRIRRVDAKTGIISNYAGSGATGAPMEGRPALEASFMRLARIAVDDRGNVYVADSPSHRIFVIDAVTRTIRTLIGTGEPGYSGDGGPAAAARLHFPEGVVAAANGDIYFADVANHRVRRIDVATGVVTTIAGTGQKGFSGDGGPAIDARLHSPGRVWPEQSGHVLIADILNARIRRIDPATGTIETVAGSGDLGDGGPATDALLSVPGDLVYADRNLYVADYGTQRVRRIDLRTGEISTVAGGGVRVGQDIPATEAEFSLPEGIAAGGPKAVYIADNIQNRIFRVDLGTGLIRTVAGEGRERQVRDEQEALTAQLSLPSAMDVGPDGRLYVAEFGARRIRIIDPAAGVISTLRTADNRPFDGPITSFAAAPGGDLFALAHGTNRIFRLDPHGKLTMLPELNQGTPPSGDSQFIDIAVSGTRLYLADALAHRILRFDLRTSRLEVVAGSGKQGLGGDGAPADRALLFQPGAVAISDDGRELFIADTKNHRVRRVLLAPDEGETLQ